MSDLSGSVGKGGKNNRPDVKLVQQLLNAELPAGKTPLATDGIFGPKTGGALFDFQKRKNLGTSGLVAPRDATWRTLTQGTAAQRTLNPHIPAPAAPSGVWPAKFTFEQFWDFTEPLEGGFAANCMLMVQDLQVATGMGITFSNKADRNTGLAMALRMKWVSKHDASKECSPTEIAQDYDAVLAREDLGRLGPGRLNEWQRITNCRTTPEGLRQGVREKIIENIKYVKTLRKGSKELGDFDSFPADAQLCVASLTWACGNEFNFPAFAKACREADWASAERECTFSNKENTLPRRQAQQQQMMHNARCTALGVSDPNTLHFPSRLVLPSKPVEEKHTYRERHIEISTG